MDKSMLDKLLVCDYSKEENVRDMRKALCEIKPLAKYSSTSGTIQFDVLERVITVIATKYKVTVQYITFHRFSDGKVQWQISLKRDDTHKWLGSYSGRTMYEVMCKGALAIYRSVKEQGIPERQSYEEEVQELKERLGERFGAETDDKGDEDWG